MGKLGHLVSEREELLVLQIGLVLDVEVDPDNVGLVELTREAVGYYPGVYVNDQIVPVPFQNFIVAIRRPLGETGDNKGYRQGKADCFFTIGWPDLKKMAEIATFTRIVK